MKYGVAQKTTMAHQHRKEARRTMQEAHDAAPTSTRYVACAIGLVILINTIWEIGG